MNHQFELHLQEAIDTVAAWDIPEEDFADAVNCQARLMSGLSPSDDYWSDDSDTPIQ
jgi:hypothetical protein